MTDKPTIPQPVKGWYTEERAQAEQAAKAREVQTERLDRIGVPKRFHQKTLESYVPRCDASRKAHRWVSDYAQDLRSHLADEGPVPDTSPGRSCLLLGRPGTGKSHLAIGVIRAITSVGSAHFTTVQAAVRSIKDTWSKDSKVSETRALQTLTGPDLLVLDEVGIQFGSEFEANLLFDVLNDRYANERPTILLSNLDIDTVRQFLGERVMDRLREDGGAVMLFDWDSYRGAQR